MKILIVGDKEVGKTCFAKRASGEEISSRYRQTIGVDIHEARFLQNGNEALLHFWDIAGQEINGNMTKTYYQGAQGAFIAIDGLRPSFTSAQKWLTDLKNKWEFTQRKEKYPIILLVTKFDSAKNSADCTASYEHFCKTNNLYDWKQISVYDYPSVRSACDAMIDMCRLSESLEKEEVNTPLKDQTSPELSNVAFTAKEKSLYDLFLKDFFVALNNFPEEDSVKISYLHTMLLVLFFGPSAEELRKRIKSDNQSKKIVEFVVNKLSSKTEDKDKVTDIRNYLLGLGLESLKIS